MRFLFKKVGSMNNRLHNCKNPHQGISKKVLCVCSAGLLRSPTAAKVLWQEFGYNTRACGIDTEYALVPLDSVLLDWCDEVVCMDKHQEIELMTLTHKPIINLSIKDNFEYMNETLVDLIKVGYGREKDQHK